MCAYIFMLSCVSLAVEVACKEIEDTLALEVLHVCKLLLLLKEIKQPSAKKGPAQSLRNPLRKWVLTIFFPLSMFFRSIVAWLFKLSSFSVRSKMVSISDRFSFASSCYLSLHLGPLSKIPGNPPTFFSPVLLFFFGLFLSSGLMNNKEQHKPTEIGIFCFYGLLVLRENF